MPEVSAPVSRVDDRIELSGFLKSRRARLRPQDVGLRDHGGVRRVAGLRREELAQVAGCAPMSAPADAVRRHGTWPRSTSLHGTQVIWQSGIDIGGRSEEAPADICIRTHRSTTNAVRFRISHSSAFFPMRKAS